jgi:SAM-dependent methyltransferase
MKRHETSFEQVGELFADDYYNRVRGYIRREVTRINLMEHIPVDRSLAVLDFGTGDGSDALWLAEQEHDVLGVDESEKMLSKAADKLYAVDAIVQDHIRFKSGLPPEIDALPYESYDLVLSHGVLQYELEDPVDQLIRLKDRLKPGGMLSLLTKNRWSAQEEVKDPAQKAVFEQTGLFINNLGIQCKAYSLKQTHALLGEAGFMPVRDYGVRIHSYGDNERISEILPRKLQFILNRELTDSRDPDFVEKGRMIHTIAIRG